MNIDVLMSISECVASQCLELLEARHSGECNRLKKLNITICSNLLASLKNGKCLTDIKQGEVYQGISEKSINRK